jgi:dipeptidyl aminopeptidase/acylaminoacyl peptidase
MLPAFSVSLSRLRAGGTVRLAFASRSEDISLQMVDLGTTRSDGSLKSRPLLDATRLDVPAAFSPDGQTIAFHGIAVGLPWRLFLSRKDGNDLRALTLLDRPPNVSPKFGSWSPDGRKIVFDALADGNSDIYVTSADGGAPTRLTTDAATDIQPSWSRDGQSIYYSSNRTGRHEIWRLPADGGAASQISRRGGAEPRESLDGRQILFLNGIPVGLNGLRSPGELRMSAVHGREEQTILPRVGLGLWGITERGILYAAEEPGRDIINLYDTRYRRVSRIGHLTFRIPRMNAVCRIAFSSDGLLALSNRVDRAEADIVMIDNFR